MSWTFLAYSTIHYIWFSTARNFNSILVSNRKLKPCSNPMFNRKHVNELEECIRTMTASDGNQGVQIVHTAKLQIEDGNLPHLHKLAVALHEDAFLAFWSTSKISQPLPFVPLKVEKFQFHSHLLLDGPSGNGNIRSFCKRVHSSPQKCQDTVYAFKLTPPKGMLTRSLSFFSQSLKSFC